MDDSKVRSLIWLWDQIKAWEKTKRIKEQIERAFLSWRIEKEIDSWNLRSNESFWRCVTWTQIIDAYQICNILKRRCVGNDCNISLNVQTVLNGWL